MKLQTKYFGEIDWDAEDEVRFASGLFGFEDEHSFVLLPFAGSGGTLLCLQSTVTPGLAFVVMDPFSLHLEYSPQLTSTELESLEVGDSAELGYYVLCVVKSPVSESTVNLKCPVAVNPRTRAARQVILDTDDYQMRHPLSQFEGKEGAC